MLPNDGPWSCIMGQNMSGSNLYAYRDNWANVHLVDSIMTVITRPTEVNASCLSLTGLTGYITFYTWSLVETLVLAGLTH